MDGRLVGVKTHVTENAQRRGVDQEVLCRARGEPSPPHGEEPAKVTVSNVKVDTARHADTGYASSNHFRASAAIA